METTVTYMAMELSDKHWKLVFSDGGEKRRHETMEAGYRMELVEAIKKAKEKFGLSPETGVASTRRVATGSGCTVT